MIQFIGNLGALAVLLGFAAAALGVAFFMIFDVGERTILYGFACGLVGLVVMIPSCVIDMEERKEVFMRDCLQERKQYECNVMWRASEGSGNAVIVQPAARVK